MLTGGGMNDYRLISASTVDLSDAEPMPLQPPPDLGGAQVHIQPVTFDFAHGLRPVITCPRISPPAAVATYHTGDWCLASTPPCPKPSLWQPGSPAACPS